MSNTVSKQSSKQTTPSQSPREVFEKHADNYPLPVTPRMPVVSTLAQDLRDVGEANHAVSAARSRGAFAQVHPEDQIFLVDSEPDADELLATLQDYLDQSDATDKELIGVINARVQDIRTTGGPDE